MESAMMPRSSICYRKRSATFPGPYVNMSVRRLRSSNIILVDDDLVQERANAPTHFDAHHLGLSADNRTSSFERLPIRAVVVGLSIFALFSALLAGFTFWKVAVVGILLTIDQILTNCFLTLVTFFTWQPVLYLGFFCLGFVEPVRAIVLDKVADLTRQPWVLIFLTLFSFKFIKVVVHLISYIFYRPVCKPAHPKYSSQDVTVVLPTVGNFSCNEFLAEWTECLTSILINNPGRIVVSVVGAGERKGFVDACNKIYLAAKSSQPLLFQNVSTRLSVVSVEEPNKRYQSIKGGDIADTSIICYADDHIFWPAKFLEASLANFEDPHVGLVGTVKRVRRERGTDLWQSILNYLAVIYLERHNFEFTASNNLDGGVSVISGRTLLARTEILQDPNFKQGYLNETWAFGLVGPMKVADDNFISRYVDNHGYKTVFHNSPDVLVRTRLGINGWEKFYGQLIRWARTTWRSNATSLLVDRTCWRKHPWTTYASFFSSLFNHALIYDPALFYTLWKAGEPFEGAFYALGVALFLSKIIKPFPHLCRHPKDIPFLFVGILFGYFHSLVRIWALLTATNIDWSGREGIKAVAGFVEVPDAN